MYRFRDTTPNPSHVGEGRIYRLDGTRVSGKPTKKGLYIRNGRKMVVK